MYRRDVVEGINGTENTTGLHQCPTLALGSYACALSAAWWIQIADRAGVRGRISAAWGWRIGGCSIECFTDACEF